MRREWNDGGRRRVVLRERIMKMQLDMSGEDVGLAKDEVGL